MSSPQQTRGFTVRAGSIIHAPVELVWSILIDLPRYHEWNTFVPVMESTLEVGSLLRMEVQMNEKMRTTEFETVTVVEPYHRLAWDGRRPRWLIKSERFQIIEPVDATTTRYSTHETFGGLLSSYLKRRMGADLQRNFTSVADNLKERAESLYAQEATRS